MMPPFLSLGKCPPSHPDHWGTQGERIPLGYYRAGSWGETTRPQRLALCRALVASAAGCWHAALVSELLLDSRVVDVPRSSNALVVTPLSWQTFFFHGHTHGLRFSDAVGVEDPGIQ